MPKIRCRSCEAVLNLPEKALGKTIACPKCKNKIKVPAGKSAKASSPKKKTPQPEQDDDIFGFGKLDDYDLEDKGDQICPYCAAELNEEDPVCRSCGMNVETGQMDRREAKIRARKGPDPSLFYKAAWVEPWNFLKKEWMLAIRTGTAWTLFGTLTCICGFMGFVYIQEQMPPKVFWIFMTALMILGIPGWFWILGLKIVETSRLRTKFQSDRIHFEFFSSIASGIRAVFWAPIMLGPVSILAGAGSFFVPAIGPIIAALTAPIPHFILPMAFVHLTARHSYKGWILWELITDCFRNFIALLYCHLVVLIVFLPCALIAVPIVFFGMLGGTSFIVVTRSITQWIIDTGGFNYEEGSWFYVMLSVPLNIMAIAILIAPIAYSAAFPAIFFLKLMGVFGYYNQETIDTVDRIRPGTPATFWIRYLAHTVDTLLFPLTCFIVSTNRKASIFNWLGIAAMVLTAIFSGTGAVLPILIVWLLYSNWMYWVLQESSELQATIGKDSFGLIVLTEDDKTLSLSQANTKWFLRLIFDAIIGLPYLMAAMPPQKKALHDIITKTKVVWKGDR